MILRKHDWTTILPLPLLLAACSGEPELSDTHAALGAQAVQQSEPTSQLHECPEDHAGRAQHARFAVFSDPHFYDKVLGVDGPAFDAYLRNDRKMLVESEEILQSVVERIIAAHPEFVLIPGDLTKDGERINHERFAEYLRRLEDAGIEAFVVPGNHDVMNPDARAYTSSGAVPTDSVSEREFKRIYRDFGYDQALDRDRDSLSYLAEPVKGVWLLALDSTRHRENTSETGPVTAGRLTPETKAWALSKLQLAKRRGKRVVAMMHHGLIEHFAGQRQLFPEYVIEDADLLAKDLSQAGLSVVFTGHFHANDIANKAVEGGSVITDVETGSLATYPSPYRLVDFELINQKMVVTTEQTTTLPGKKDFGSYAAKYLDEGMRGLVTYTLTTSGGLNSATAQAIAPVIAQAFEAHYAGDEPPPNKATLDTASMLAASGTVMGQVWSSALLSLYDDPTPADNNVVLRLGKSNAPVHFYTEPYLVSPSPANRMSVIWLTAEPAEDSFVLYGKGPNYGRIARAKTYPINGMMTVDANGQYTVPLPVYQHVAELDDLDPGQQYFYRAASQDQLSFGYDFRTAPRKGASAEFVLLSDLQLKPGIPTTVRMAGNRGADFIIYNGDLQNVPTRAGEWFAVRGGPEEYNKRWFPVMQQRDDGARLMQSIPIFPSPGNHEVDDQSLLTDKSRTARDKISLGIYMQLFRPLYPEQQPFLGGRHWYSADYGDLHIVSLSLFRWFAWPATESPGWYLFDDIKAGSPQFEWLKEDLARNRRPYTWVTQHWHMMNRSVDVLTPFTDPIPSATDPNVMTYDPASDNLLRDLKPLYEKHRVTGVSFGHSHVYERYRINGVNYIEAASIGNNYRSPTDPVTSPNLGIAPEFEENRFRSFMLLSMSRQGLSAQGIQTSVEADGVGALGRVFDQFMLTN